MTDTPPTSAVTYLAQVQQRLAAQQYGTLATMMGRFYAMDRDKRWDRVKVYYIYIYIYIYIYSGICVGRMHLVYFMEIAIWS